MEPDIVPDKLENKINYKIILLIVGITVFFQVSLYYIDSEENRNLIIYVVSIINPLVASFASFLVAKRYTSSKTFSRAYYALGFGYVCATLGEIIYVVYVVLELETFPSIVDVFFFGLYPFVLAHLIINIRFFKPKIKSLELLWMALIPLVVVSIYITSSFEGDADLPFYFGVIYVLEPAIVLPLAILGAKTFRGGVIGNAWLVLVLAIITLTIGDVWYSYIEIFDHYDLLHPVNMFWYAGYWIVVYALYKHKEGV